MADDDQYNDEYQFADLDEMNTHPEEENESASTTPVSDSEGAPGRYPTKNIKRNALIALAVVILAMLLYKLASSVFSEKKVDIDDTALPVAVQAPISVEPSVPTPVEATPAATVDPNVSQKLSALEVSQQSMRSDVSSIGEQLNTLSANVSSLTATIADLNGIVTNLSAKVDEQSREIEQITVRREAKRVHAVKHHVAQYPKYYLQAVIPGRAWLIATNGATLTVREGTTIAGYGTVKLIDPKQGRVATSSGQVIKFSQEDS